MRSRGLRCMPGPHMQKRDPSTTTMRPPLCCTHPKTTGITKHLEPGLSMLYNGSHHSFIYFFMFLNLNSLVVVYFSQNGNTVFVSQSYIFLPEHEARPSSIQLWLGELGPTARCEPWTTHCSMKFCCPDHHQYKMHGMMVKEKWP